MNTIKLINEGKDIEAISSLGLKVKKDRKLQGSFLEKAIQLSNSLSESNSHSGGILVTPDTKVLNSRELLSENLNINYLLTEDVSAITANTISSISLLTEDNAIIDINGYFNIRNTLKEGLGVLEESLTNVYRTTSNIIKKSLNLLNESLVNTKYNRLIGNTIISTNTLVNLKKAKEFADNNVKALAESHRTEYIKNDPDTVLFGTLDLQENLINTYMDNTKVNNAILTKLSDSKDISDLSEYITTIIDQIAIPISEGSISLSTDSLINSFNRSIESIASLYDEYIQDYVG